MADPFDELLSNAPSARRGSAQPGITSATTPSSPDALIDLSSPELSKPISSRETTLRPMRPSPPPPQPAVQPAGAVDGLPQEVLDLWFEIADADKDGRVANTEAVEFFLQSGLSPVELRQIYLRVKTPELNAREGVGLNKLRFAQMLRLIALAQSELPLSDENISAALDSAAWLRLHGKPLPPPRIVLRSSPLAQQAGSVGSAAAGGSADLLGEPTVGAPGGGALLGGLWPALPSGRPLEAGAGAQGSGPALQAAPAAAYSTTTTIGTLTHAMDDDDDLFGLNKLALRGAPAQTAATGEHAGGGVEAAAGNSGPALQPRLSRTREISSSASGRGMSPTKSASRLGRLEAPLAYEVRLPPLNPKQSAPLSMLAAGNGSLFAGPGLKTSVLQWAEAEGNLRPACQGTSREEAGGPDAAGLLPRAAGEDVDSAPCAEVHVTSRKQPTCLLVDPVAEVLWVADKEGWVSGYDVGGEPGAAVGAACCGGAPWRRLYHFAASRVAWISAMCITPLGELWTGTSRGGIRVWHLDRRAPGGAPPQEEPLVCRELRKPMGERAHGSSVLALACPADGQLVWSTSSKTTLLWDAGSGVFMGVVQRVVRKLGSGLVVDATMRGADDLLKYTIKSSKGLELDPVTGAILERRPGWPLGRPPAGDRQRLQAEQEAWAAQSDKSVNEFVERVSAGGSAVVQGAGKAMKLIGKFGAKLAQNLGAVESDGGSFKLGANAALDEELSKKAAKAGSFTEDRSDRVCSLITTPDNHVWVGHSKGRIDRFTAAGMMVWSKEIGASLQTVCSVGQHVWAGFANGMLSVLDAEGAALKVFSAHGAGIISMAQAGSRTYTLAADGSIRGWSSSLPQEADTLALAEWDDLSSSCVSEETLDVLCVTWNVGESKPPPCSPFFSQLKDQANCPQAGVQLVMVGLQEIEMGGSSVALGAAKDALARRLQERGNTNAKFWGASILEALGSERWYQVALRQLSGMLILVFARAELKKSIGEVATASVACGVLGVGGNKGAVAAEFTLHRRKVAAVCSHFAAHQKEVKARNANYEMISRQLTFKRKPWFAPLGGEELPEEEEEGPPDCSSQSFRRNKTPPPMELAAVGEETRSEEGSEGPGGQLDLLPNEELIQGEGMRYARLLVWLGDFNYRIDDLSYVEVKELIQRESWEQLLERDQCRQQYAAGNVFRGLQEGPIRFRPTYKFDKGVPNPEAYDTSEKQRIPAWCDRVFFRGTPQEEECPASERVVASALDYNCWLDVLDSDHKPVYARLEVHLQVTDYDKKREICSRLLAQCVAPVGVPSGVALHVLDQPAQGLQLRNGGQQAVRFNVSVDLAACEALGCVVEVLPVVGLVRPGESATVYITVASLDPDVMRQPDAKVMVGSEGSKKDLSVLVEAKVLVRPEHSLGMGDAKRSTRELPFKVAVQKR